MDLLYAPDSYGGFLSATEACVQFEDVLASRGLLANIHPMSDGGEGLLQTLTAHTTLELHGLHVDAADGSTIFASAARWKGSWWLESAQAIGVQSPESPIDPFQASSTGLGQLLTAAGARAPGPMVVGLGGSRTIDGGIGALRALGLHALDRDGHSLGPRPTAADLLNVDRLEGLPPLADRVLRILCDVRTPLAQATARFGPQKGVEADQVAAHTDALMHWADVLNAWRASHGRSPLDPDCVGGGAAGGLGFALAAIGGHRSEGAPVMARLTGLEDAIRGKTVVVIGEGRLDKTSFDGKVANTVVQAARGEGARVLALVGSAREVPPAPQGPDEIIEIGEASLPAFRQAVIRLCERLA